MWPTTGRPLVALLLAIQLACFPGEQVSSHPVDNKPITEHDRLETKHREDQDIPLAQPRANLNGFRSECASLEAYETGPWLNQPDALVKVAPEFSPTALRLMRIQGVVILKVLVTATGKVCDTLILKGLMPMFDEPIRNAVLQWQFTPVSLHGRPVAVVFTVSVYVGL